MGVLLNASRTLNVRAVGRHLAGVVPLLKLGQPNHGQPKMLAQSVEPLSQQAHAFVDALGLGLHADRLQEVHKHHRGTCAHTLSLQLRLVGQVLLVKRLY